MNAINKCKSLRIPLLTGILVVLPAANLYAATFMPPDLAGFEQHDERDADGDGDGSNETRSRNT